MKIVRLAADQLVAVSERQNFFGFDQDHVLGVLNLAFDDEKRFLRDEKPHPLE
jgi:hypothetical protein